MVYEEEALIFPWFYRMPSQEGGLRRWLKSCVVSEIHQLRCRGRDVSGAIIDISPINETILEIAFGHINTRIFCKVRGEEESLLNYNYRRNLKLI